MRKTFYGTRAFLCCCGHDRPTFEIKGELPKNYCQIIIKDCFGQAVIPSGFNQDGAPYCSDKFYQKLKELFNLIEPVDPEQAKNLFWFDVTITC